MSAKRLGAFLIEEEIGAGGMGVVYRARDEKLGRAVAIKVLPESVAADPERLARFDREARLLASLNHPNVAVLHGLEQDGQTRFLVMELVAGESLQKRIAAGPIPVAKALPMALQVASAFEAAHAQGIVHRDLKPGNVMLTPEGRIKLLDFGLAKMLAADSGSFRDRGSRATTMSGILLGTPGYMAPEQASGDPVDRRADIWAFGCLLFEMLSGRRAFGGDSMAAVLTAVLSAQPDWNLLPADAPAGIRRLLRRCLAKDPHRRLHEIADARIEIEEALAPPSGTSGEFGMTLMDDDARLKATTPPASPPATRVRPSPTALAGWLPSLALVLIALPLLLQRRQSTGAEPAGAGLRRYAVTLPDTLNLAGDYSPTVAISPDGRWVAGRARTPDWRLVFWIHDLVTGDARTIERTGLYTVAFSADSRELLVQTDTARWAEDLATGATRPLRHDGRASAPLAAAWLPDGRFILNDEFGRPMSLADPDGSNLRTIIPIDTAAGEIGHVDPRPVPGGDWVLFTVYLGKNWDLARIDAVNVRSLERRRVLEGASAGHPTRNGQLLHVRGNDLLTIDFDPSHLTVSGPARTVVRGVQFLVSTGMASFDVTDDGTLAYVPGGVVSVMNEFVWIDEAGAETPVAIPPGSYGHPALSPDGQFVALTMEGAEFQIGVARTDGGPVTPVTFGSDDTRPRWSGDGRFLSYTGESPQRYVMIRPVDGSAPAHRLGKLRGFINSWSSDGRLAMAGTWDDAANNRDIVIVHLGDESIEPWAATPAIEYQPALSPDDRWVAYLARDSGDEQAYVRPLRGPGGPWRIPGSRPRAAFWSRDGRSLYVQTDDGEVFAVPVGRSASFEPGTPRRLFTKPIDTQLQPAPDGRFLGMKVRREPGPGQIEIVRNWSGLVTGSSQ